MSSFYITLMSDSSMDLFQDNTQCCFRTKLAKPIHLNKQDWEIALVEMIVPSQVINVTEEERHFYIVTHDPVLGKALENFETYCTLPNKEEKGVRLCIPIGTYVTPQHLIETIDFTVKDQLGKIFRQKGLRFTMGFSGQSKRAKLDSSDQLGIQFHPHMFIKLGGAPDSSSTIFFKDTPEPFPHGVDINMGHNHLFVYSDLASYTYLGNIEAPILRVAPFDPRTKAGTNPHIHFEFLNLHYVPLAKADFDTITIHIRGDTGQSIQFIHGKSMVKLHLRQRQ